VSDPQKDDAYWEMIALKMFLLNPAGDGHVFFELFKEGGWGPGGWGPVGIKSKRLWVPEYVELHKLVGIHPLEYNDAGPLHAAIIRLNKQRGKGK
jgi:hypothetical protein